MAQPADLTKAITEAKKKVAERKTAVESVRQDQPLRGLRKTLRRLQRKRRSGVARQTLLKAKMTKKTTGGDAAKAG
jgi:hypothetical protein